MQKPEQELINFGKTRLLNPCEIQTLTFEIMPRNLCSFDETLNAWVAEAGDYSVKTGASANNIKHLVFNIVMQD